MQKIDINEIVSFLKDDIKERYEKLSEDNRKNVETLVNYLFNIQEEREVSLMLGKNGKLEGEFKYMVPQFFSKAEEKSYMQLITDSFIKFLSMNGVMMLKFFVDGKEIIHMCTVENDKIQKVPKKDLEETFKAIPFAKENEEIEVYAEIDCDLI